MKNNIFFIALIALFFTVSFTPSVYCDDIPDGAQIEAVIIDANDFVEIELSEGVTIYLLEAGVGISPGDNFAAEANNDDQAAYIYIQKYLGQFWENYGNDCQSALTNSFVNSDNSRLNGLNYDEYISYPALNSVNNNFNERKVFTICWHVDASTSHYFG